MNSKKKILNIIYITVFSLSFFVAVVCAYTSQYFDCGIDSILFTLAVPFKGANMSMLFLGILICAPIICLGILVYVLMVVASHYSLVDVIIDIRFIKWRYSFNLFNQIKNVCFQLR